MKKVKLREESYNKLKQILINEISYGTVDKAYDRSDELFYDVRIAFEDFYDALKEAINKDKWDNGSEVNPYLAKIKELSQPIYDILNRKMEQQGKFYDETMNKVDQNKFNAENDNDIEDMDLRQLQDNYPK